MHQARNEDTRESGERRIIDAMAGATHQSPETQRELSRETSRAIRVDVRSATVVFRVIRGELSVGLPIARRAEGASERGVPTVAPNDGVEGFGLDTAAQLAASLAVPARDIVRIEHAGVRAVRTGTGAPSVDNQTLYVVSWAIARPLAAAAGTAQSVEAEEVFVPIASIDAHGALHPSAKTLVACAFEAFLDATLADALTRRLLPRHVLFRKTDGFAGRSPYEDLLGMHAAPARADTPGAAHGDLPVPIFVGLLPDPFPLSALREFYEHLLGAALDRGNFRRQFQEIVSSGPIKALPIFERGVPHRAGQLFTFDRSAWNRFATTKA